MESSVSLTLGDRRATNFSHVTKFSIDGKYVRLTLNAVLHAIVGSRPSVVPPPANYSGNFFRGKRFPLIFLA